MYCWNCGKEIDEKAAVCPNCGVMQIRDTPDVSQIINSQRRARQEAESVLIYALIGFFIPVAGLVLFLVWRDQYPRRALAAGKGALVSVILSVALGIIAGIIGAVSGIFI